MKDVLKQIIVDFYKRQLPELTPRNIEFPKLPDGVRKACVYIGMRRSGKTYLMFQKIQELLSQGVKKQQILYINLEDDRLDGLKLQDLQKTTDAYFELYPELADNKMHFFFDEIHEVDHWEKFIRRLLDTEDIQIYLSGSSSKMLSKEIATSLRGRTVVREVFPFSFSEYLKHKKISIPQNPSSKERALLINQCEQFILYGGFAETINADPGVHTELLQGYIDTVIYRDIIERYEVKNTPALKRLLIQILQNPATLFSVHKFYSHLKSMGYSTSKDSLYAFVQYFEDAYCFFFVPAFNLSEYKSEQKAKKFYPVDQGLITAFSTLDGLKDAQRLETAVFCALRRKISSIYYYSTKSKKEVDFLTVDAKQNMALYQVSVSLKEPSTRKRKMDALQQAMAELKLEEGFVITRDEAETLECEEGSIHIIPVWQFLLFMHEGAC